MFQCYARKTAALYKDHHGFSQFQLEESCFLLFPFHFSCFFSFLYPSVFFSPLSFSFFLRQLYVDRMQIGRKSDFSFIITYFGRLFCYCNKHFLKLRHYLSK